MVPKKVGGAGQQRGTGKEVSMATLRAATTKGTVTLNPISGILTRPDTYQRDLRLQQPQAPPSKKERQRERLTMLEPAA